MGDYDWQWVGVSVTIIIIMTTGGARVGALPCLSEDSEGGGQGSNLSLTSQTHQNMNIANSSKYEHIKLMKI